MWNLNLNIVKASHCTWVSFFSLNQSFVKNNFKNLDNFINLHIAVFLFSALLFKWKEMGHYWLHDLGKNPTANLKRCNYFYFPSNIKWRDMKKSCISSFTREVFVIRPKKKKKKIILWRVTSHHWETPQKWELKPLRREMDTEASRREVSCAFKVTKITAAKLGLEPDTNWLYCFELYCPHPTSISTPFNLPALSYSQAKKKKKKYYLTTVKRERSGSHRDKSFLVSEMF